MDISHAAPVIHHAAPVVKTVFQGVTVMDDLVHSAIAFAFGGILAWYIRGRGLDGVKIDLANIKNDVVMLKNKIDPPTVVVAPVVTPIV